MKSLRKNVLVKFVINLGLCFVKAKENVNFSLFFNKKSRYFVKINHEVPHSNFCLWLFHLLPILQKSLTFYHVYSAVSILLGVLYTLSTTLLLYLLMKLRCTSAWLLVLLLTMVISFQKYSLNDTFHTPGGPVFIMLGGEGPANAIWLVEGAWITYAAKFGAFCLQLEHRYYGKSHPTPWVDPNGAT